MTFLSEDSAEYDHNINIKTTDDLEWFKWAELGILVGGKIMQINKNISPPNHVKLYKDEGQKSLNFKTLRLSRMKMQ